MLESYNLFDMGWSGSYFTWSNNHSDESLTKDRLDRVVANPK